MNTGQEVRRFTGHLVGPMSVAFAPDGRAVASGGGDSTVLLWDFTGRMKDGRWRQNIKPTEPVDGQRVERLIRDLDSDDFSIRTKATEELGKIVDGAEPALRKKLAEKPALEMRRRIEEVLNKLEPAGERLRTLRAIQVLEYMVTAEAREHLRMLAKGVPHARLTREAKAALERQKAEPRPSGSGLRNRSLTVAARIIKKPWPFRPGRQRK